MNHASTARPTRTQHHSRPARPGRPATAAALGRARRARHVYTVTYSGTALSGYTIHRVIPRSMGPASSHPLLDSIHAQGHDYVGITALSASHAVRLVTAELRDRHTEELYRLGIEQDDADDEAAVTVALP